jgi:DNA-binding GntR family transcriptional regulator
VIKSVKVSVRTMAAERAGIRHRTMAEAALDELREAIVLGELVPGTPLRLEDLAASLGMSISPIREAVRQLEALGLAEHVPHHGAKVVAIDVEELRDLFQVRLVLETMAVRRAAERFTDEDRERASELLEQCVEARSRGDLRHAMRVHGGFHFALYEASRSAWLVRLIRPAWESCERYRAALLAQQGSLQDRHQEIDQELLAACAARDPERAADALFRHLELFGDFYSRELGGRGIFQD